MRYSSGWLFSAIALAALLAGCAEKGPIFLNVGYQPAEVRSGTQKKIIAGVSPLKDSRGRAASVLGKRKTSSGIENDLMAQVAVSDLVASGLKNALKARGVMVKDAAAWDMTEGNIPAGNFDILLGGEITTLWLESTSAPFKTSLKGSVQLKIVAADASGKKIIRTLNVNSKVEQDVLYSREKLESVLSEALSSALDQIFADSVLEIKLQ